VGQVADLPEQIGSLPDDIVFLARNSPEKPS